METSGLKIVEQRFTDLIDQMGELFDEHWEEIARNKEVMILKPDYQKYRALEEIGACKSLIAYYDGKLVGYSINFIQPHMHYSDLVICYNDIVYTDPAYRSKPVGLRLLKETEKKAKEWGARMMLWHVKPDTPMFKIMPRLAYNLGEVIYSKVL